MNGCPNFGGVFEKNDRNELVLTACFGTGNKAQLIAQVKKSCGWDLRVSSNADAVSPVDPHSLKILRALDPEGAFTRG